MTPRGRREGAPTVAVVVRVVVVGASKDWRGVEDMEDHHQWEEARGRDEGNKGRRERS